MPKSGVSHFYYFILKEEVQKLKKLKKYHRFDCKRKAREFLNKYNILAKTYTYYTINGIHDVTVGMLSRSEIIRKLNHPLFITARGCKK